MILGLEFPPISHTVNWPDLFLSGPLAVNKVVLLMWASVAIVFAFYFLASRKRSLVPKGAQNLAESVVEFVDDGIIMQTMGKDGLGWSPFLVTLFSFVFVCNIWEIIPGAQMPVNARIALPLLMTGVVFVLYHFIGMKNQGFIGYWKGIMFPPGVPWPIYILVTPIELVTYLVTRPLSLSVRLFANMLAGHLILITFAVLTTALFTADVFYVPAVLPFALLVALTGFEILVSALQAYIFTILTAVYIGGAMHPEH